jgi:lipoprotein-anchoring transpeptidase ErfK/SrfK
MSRGLLIGGAAVVVTILVLVVVVFAVDAGNDDQIADGIKVGGVDLGGLSVDAARGKLQRALGSRVREPVTLTYASQRYVLRPDKANVRLDVAGSVEAARKRGREGSALRRVLGGGGVHADLTPRLSYPRGKLEAFVGRISQRVGRPARDADIDMRNGKLIRRHARNGVEVRRAQLLTALVAQVTRPAASRSLKVPVKVVERPDRTLDDLARRYATVIGIDRDRKVLRLYKRLRLDRRYTIAVGRQGLESSPGRYKIQEKIVNPAWHVPNKAWAGSLAGQTIAASDPRNPLVARWMGYHDGEGIHGTKDIASLGEQASHGCIRMSPKAVKELFRQVKVGTPVFLQ